MNAVARNNYWVILVTLLVAMLLDLLPLPGILQYYWPEWVAMVLLYWIIALPQRVGIFTAWLVGLFIDAVQGDLLGMNGLGLALMSYFGLLLYQRIRLFPRWKQAFVSAMLIGIYMLMVLGLKRLMGPLEIDFSYWIPMFVSAFFWPWVFILLRDIRRQFRVH